MPSIASYFLWASLVLLVFGAVVAISLLLEWLTRPRPSQLELAKLIGRARSTGFWSGTYANFVYFGGKSYRVRELDQQVCDWLTSLVWEWRHGNRSEKPPRKLLEFRRDFRSITAIHPIGGLVCCLQSPNRDLRRLATWLLGRSTDGATVTAVKALRQDPDTGVRREVAKALRRMAEWTELHSIAQHDENAWVRTQAGILSSSGRRPFAERLAQFKMHGASDVFQPGRFSSHMPVFMLQPVGPGKPAKSREWIRRILEHIREMVYRRFKNHAA